MDPSAFELGGGLGDRGLEVQGVGQVGGRGDIDGAGAVGVAGVHIDPAGLGGR